MTETNEALQPFVWKAIETRLYEACDGSIWRTAEEATIASANARNGVSRIPDVSEAIALIDARIADLETANEQLRSSLRYEAPSIQRNDRERLWLKDLKSVLRLTPLSGTPVPAVARETAIRECLAVAQQAANEQERDHGAASTGGADVVAERIKALLERQA